MLPSVVPKANILCIDEQLGPAIGNHAGIAPTMGVTRCYSSLRPNAAVLRPKPAICRTSRVSFVKTNALLGSSRRNGRSERGDGVVEEGPSLRALGASGPAANQPNQRSEARDGTSTASTSGRLASASAAGIARGAAPSISIPANLQAAAPMVRGLAAPMPWPSTLMHALGTLRERARLPADVATAGNRWMARTMHPCR